jgi:hypothetical protein
MKPKGDSLGKINKMDTPLARLIKEKKKDSNY